MSGATPTLAANFTLEDSTFAIIDGTAVMPENFGNVRNLNNIQLVNDSDRTEDLSFVLANTWTLIEGQLIGLEWDNAQDGWFNNNIDGTNTSLLVTVTNTADRIRLGDIADRTGQAPYPTTQPCDDSPSCYQSPFPFPIDTVTQSSDSLLPIYNLGTFAPQESKTFSQSVLFTYSDNREGSTPILVSGFTANPTAQDVPEPLVIGGLVLIGAALIKQTRETA